MEVRFGPDLRYFLWSLILGILLAVLYDILRFSRRTIRTADIIVNLEDILFIVLSGGLVAVLAYLVNNGFFRVYSLISTVLGFALYRFAVRDGLVWVLSKIYNGIVYVLRFIAKILLFPVKLILRVARKPVVLTIGSVKKRVKRKKHTA